MAVLKPYGRAALIDMCGGSEQSVRNALPWHDLREGGLWLTGRDFGLGGAELATMRWHPCKNSAVPALPFPFAACDLAAFFLAGGGLFLYERFDFEAIDADMPSQTGCDSGKRLDLKEGYRDARHDTAHAQFEAALRNLGDNADEGREALRKAIKLRRMADNKFGRSDEDVRRSAEWLLSNAHLELTALHSDSERVRARALDAAPIAGAQHAAASAPASVSTTVPTVIHKLKRRADQLAAVIAKAKSEALNANDWTSVWAALVAMAQSADRPPPLLGYAEGEGVKYQTDSAEAPVGWMTREAWRKRASRRM